MRWRTERLTVAAIRGEVVARAWSPPGVATDRLLVAHDGADYDAYGGLGLFLSEGIAAGRIPPCHLVLLDVGDERLEHFSASPAYARGLALDLLPRLKTWVGADGPVVGAGVSLGALALLHAQRRHPAAFAGLFLQSGSYFQPRYDAQERGFARWLRIVRFTGRVLRSASGPAIPVALTCGTAEENLANNRDMADALSKQGYPLRFAEVPGGHSWESWRDALDPRLTDLLRKVWSPHE